MIAVSWSVMRIVVMMVSIIVVRMVVTIVIVDAMMSLVWHSLWQQR